LILPEVLNQRLNLTTVMKRRVVGCSDWLPRDRSGVLADQRHDGHRPNRCRIEQSQSAADLDGAYSPAMSRQDATPDQIATGHVIVIAKAATTETTAAETAAMEAATTVAATTTMATTAMGEGSRAGSAEQDSRCADNAEAANGEQSCYRQPAPQDVVVARAVLSH
jgi:hypothetical protein